MYSTVAPNAALVCAARWTRGAHSRTTLSRTEQGNESKIFKGSQTNTTHKQRELEKTKQSGISRDSREGRAFRSTSKE